MGLTNSVIETGVDKLVSLINAKGKIASYDAAKELGVSSTVVMEWADFLEEEGIINIEYKFTKPFLIARKLVKKDVQEKAKEFSGKKDIFVRKAEISLIFLDKEAEKLKQIKDEFDKIKKELGFDMGSVKNELEELDKYEQLKIGMDKQIENQRTSAMYKIEEMTRRVLRERKKYQYILSEIKKEEHDLDSEKNEVHSLEESEKIIKSRINKLKAIIEQVESRVKQEEENVQISESHIQKLDIMAKTMKIRVETEKGVIEHLIAESKEQTKKIKELQNRVIEKIAGKEKKLKGVKKASKKIKELFKKRMGIMNLIERMNKDRNVLQKELIALIRKAKSFELSSKSANIGDQIVNIEKKFKEVDTKKKFFEKEVKKLNTFFK
ncbi:MAG: hypothetical protein QF436_00910 [Candidatus Woesearchaeota archaeon]|jgi:hypothetical protein|nr:hypothetical protein [Candidatus Woesearchaeota archaeon]MDP7622655.1 hypothetical protein [Candidatus Woesearchaeota archaeon]HJN57258.1 hypothetical protein [Candidatus Woesearchaeota archaeon]|tara:strand:- start:5117 stop:6259 length:1143 start_codon:yes stop_codon:yes gene_type:complete